MAYINGNKPIITNGLVYALDFGNTKSYTSGSNTARSIVFDPAGTTAVTGSTAIPVLSNGVLNFTGPQFVRRTGSIDTFGSTGTFTVQVVGKANTAGNLFSINTPVGNLATLITPSSSLFGFNLALGDFSRNYPGFTSSSLQHITYRYSQGTVDIFLNGIPVTASAANSALTTTTISNALFINSGSNFFSGSVAQFYVYNRALSANEIYENYLVSAGRNNLPVIPKPYSIDENVYKYVQTTGITNLDTISAIDTFVSGLKSNGLWNKMTAIYPFLTTLTGSQTVNLKDPGVLGLGLTGSFTGSNVGLTPANSTAYVDALPSNIPYPLINSASAHLSLLSYDVPQGNGFLAGNSARATGGEITISGSKAFHIFKNVGSTFFNIHDPLLTNVEVLVIAGGGAGGSRDAAGGGAGGLVYSSSFLVTPGTSIPVTVGNGGYAVPLVGSAQTPGIDGENSIFGNITAIGGGGGGVGTGRNGGSGGGGSSSGIGGLGTAGQGNNGGGGGGFSNTGGGGGGAGSVGETSTGSQIGGAGGSGSYFAQYAGINSGSPSGWFAGGGGGGGTSRSGPGGIGGGGTAGNYSQGQSGSVNTGGGGGAQRQAGYLSGAGGSGLVVVSYDYLPNTTAFTGSGTGFFLTDSALTASVNSQFTSGITGSGNIGFLTVSRTGSNSFSIRKNNSTATINSSSLGALSTDIFFNSVNLIGSSSLPQPTSISYASIGAGLTDSEVSTYYNLVSQLQTNLKRQNTLLDNYSGAAAAYSLRRIGPSGYFGPAIRVRRDSDNTLRDIGFTSDGQLDTVGLLDFVGVTGSGFVNTWYDQSGNSNNASQDTAGNQPLVIVSGSVVVENKKPTLRFDGTNDRLDATSSLLPTSLFTVFAVVQGVAGSFPSAAQIIAKNGGSAGRTNFIGTTDGLQIARIFFNDGTNSYNVTTTTPVFNLTQRLVTAQSDGLGNSQIGVNSNIEGILTGRPWTPQNTVVSIGASAGGGNEFRGIIQELVAYESYQTTSRTLVESNINTNYKIFGSATASFDPDYQAFITATGITQPTQSAALETLVSDLKSYGLWSKMKAIYPMVTDRNNRFAQSEDFSSTWNAQSASVSPTQVTAPDGTTTGDLILDIAGSTNEHYIYQTVDGTTGLVTGSEYVLSTYAKFLNTPYIAFKTNTGAQAWFDVQTGVTGSYTGSNATITNVGNGWYRCALYFTSSVATGPYNQQIHLAKTDNDLTFAGTGTSGSYLWGAQFENGNLLGPYRKTEGSGFVVSGTDSMLDQMKFNLKSTSSFSGSYFGNWNPGYSGNKPDGTTGYMNTGLNLLTNYGTSFNNHFSLLYRTDNTTSEKVGTSTGDYQNGMSSHIVYDNTLTYNDNLGRNSVSNSSYGTSKAYHLSTVTSTTSQKLYRNGIVKINGSSNPSAGYPSLNFTFGAYNNGGTIQNFSNRETGFATIGDGLTDYEAKALYWIVQKFQTTLGRQVY